MRAVLEDMLRKSAEECPKEPLDICELEALRPSEFKVCCSWLLGDCALQDVMRVCMRTIGAGKKSRWRANDLFVFVFWLKSPQSVHLTFSLSLAGPGVLQCRDFGETPQSEIMNTCPVSAISTSRRELTIPTRSCISLCVSDVTCMPNTVESMPSSDHNL